MPTHASWSPSPPWIQQRSKITWFAPMSEMSGDADDLPCPGLEANSTPTTRTWSAHMEMLDVPVT